jgi:hypothetical protein
MQSAEEKRRLLSRFDPELTNPIVALLKSLAGVLALVAVASGPWLLLYSDAGQTAAEQPAFKAARALPSAVAESKRVFDERRERHQAGPQDVASPAKNSAADVLTRAEQ